MNLDAVRLGVVPNGIRCLRNIAMRRLAMFFAVMFGFAAVACAQSGTICRSLDISKVGEWNLHAMKG